MPRSAPLPPSYCPVPAPHSQPRYAIRSNYIQELSEGSTASGEDSIRYRAICDHQGSGLKLSFKLGEEMSLINKKSLDWYDVRKANGQRGLAPANHLEEFVPVAKQYRAM